MKTCSKCGEEKPLESFSMNLGRRRPKCKQCTNAANARYYQENKGRLRKSNDEIHAIKNADPAAALLNQAKNRAKRKGLPFSITAGDIIVPTHCPVLGLKLAFGDRASVDTAPSLDQIIPGVGYVPGNVVVVSFRANRIKNDASVDELRSVLRFYEQLEMPVFSAA